MQWYVHSSVFTSAKCAKCIKIWDKDISKHLPGGIFTNARWIQRSHTHTHTWTESSLSTNLTDDTLADEQTFQYRMYMYVHRYCR